ncbi:MAG: hypothetical protein R3C44_05565 [Chloroflexota bacterium]
MKISSYLRRTDAGNLSEVRRTLRPDDGRLIFTFHHRQPEAWAALTTALLAAPVPSGQSLCGSCRAPNLGISPI